jgi:hypothetical protein
MVEKWSWIIINFYLKSVEYRIVNFYHYCVKIIQTFILMGSMHEKQY